MFSGFTSRRMMPVACAADKFSQIWPKMVEMIFAFLLAPRGSF